MVDMPISLQTDKLLEIQQPFLCFTHKAHHAFQVELIFVPIGMHNICHVIQSDILAIYHSPQLLHTLSFSSVALSQLQWLSEL